MTLSLSTLWNESAQSLQRSMFAAQFVQHGDVRGKRVTAGECVVPIAGPQLVLLGVQVPSDPGFDCDVFKSSNPAQTPRSEREWLPASPELRTPKVRRMCR